MLESINENLEWKKYEFTSNGYKVEFKKKTTIFEGMMKGKLVFKKTF